MHYRVFGFVLSTFGLIAVIPKPASAQVMSSHACTGTNPAAGEVWVFQNASFGTPCAAVFVGFYPMAGTGTGGFGIANDAVSSIKVGLSVRARLFKDADYASSGGPIVMGPGNFPSMPVGWNDVLSSMRVENNARSVTCNDLQAGEFAVFSEANFSMNAQQDCVVLKYGTQFPSPLDMGIQNNAMSSIQGGLVPTTNPCNPGTTLTGWEAAYCRNDNFLGGCLNVGTGQSNSNLTASGFNDQISSISTFPICL